MKLLFDSTHGLRSEPSEDDPSGPVPAAYPIQARDPAGDARPMLHVLRGLPIVGDHHFGLLGVELTVRIERPGGRDGQSVQMTVRERDSRPEPGPVLPWRFR